MLEQQEHPNEVKPAVGPWIYYAAPMALFLVLTPLEAKLGPYYTWIYFAKIVFVTAALILCRRAWADIRFEARLVLPAAALGAVLCAVWVGVDKSIPYPHLGVRAAFDPFASISQPTNRALFLAARFYGLVVLVPVIEELFWRSFLLRWITAPKWESIPLGTFSRTSFALVAAAFGIAHPEWLVAVIFACVMALLLRQTRSLFACIIAHATTNLCLGLYVLSTHDWMYW